jgi:hypothetical protein
MQLHWAVLGQKPINAHLNNHKHTLHCAKNLALHFSEERSSYLALLPVQYKVNTPNSMKHERLQLARSSITLVDSFAVHISVHIDIADKKSIQNPLCGG